MLPGSDRRLSDPGDQQNIGLVSFPLATTSPCAKRDRGRVEPSQAAGPAWCLAQAIGIRLWAGGDEQMEESPCNPSKKG